MFATLFYHCTWPYHLDTSTFPRSDLAYSCLFKCHFCISLHHCNISIVCMTIFSFFFIFQMSAASMIILLIFCSGDFYIQELLLSITKNLSSPVIFCSFDNYFHKDFFGEILYYLKLFHANIISCYSCPVATSHIWENIPTSLSLIRHNHSPAKMYQMCDIHVQLHWLLWWTPTEDIGEIFMNQTEWSKIFWLDIWMIYGIYRTEQTMETVPFALQVTWYELSAQRNSKIKLILA